LQVVNKSFWLDPAGQRFVNTRQLLAILSHSMEGLPDPFFPTQTQKKNSGLATRDCACGMQWKLKIICMTTGVRSIRVVKAKAGVDKSEILWFYWYTSAQAVLT